MMDAALPLSAVLAGRYRLERELGAGGMATVYLAEDLKHGRKVAIKVLRPELTAALGAARFQREIRIAAQLQHPHVLTVHDSGEADGLLYYVMPYVEGESLRERLRAGPVPVPEVVRVLMEVADALAHAHARGVVHRDIKPENILLSGRHMLVMDFGIAKALSDAGQESSGATTGIALGTPAYMAPEQATADPALDHRADLYALGVLGYELLCGRPPFEGNPQQVLAAHLTQAPVSIGKLRSDVPAALVNVIDRALAKSPAERWQHAEDMLAALEPLANPSGETARATVALPVSASSRTSALRWQLPVAALLLIAITWLVWPARQGRIIATPPGPAARASAPSPAPEIVANAAAGIPDIARDPSIAVLPFLDLSQAHDQEYFSDGIAEELLNLLARVPNLRVVARTSSFAFKGQSADTDTIARRLHVAALLEGSVRNAGDMVRINVQLVRAADGQQLWSETYDRKLDDIFKVQDDIAAAVVGNLKLRLLHAAPTARTANPQAYAAYLQAREIGQQGSATALKQSIVLFRKSLAIDPNYAPAWADLAAALCNLVAFQEMPQEAGVPLASEALEKAIGLDANYAPAYAKRALLHIVGDRDMQAAANDITHAMTLDRNDADANDIGNFLARRLGRMNLAVSLGEGLRARDPLNATNDFDLALAYRFTGRLDDAVAQWRTVLTLSPHFPSVHQHIGEVRLQQHRFEDALAEMQQEGDEHARLVGLAMAYHALGRKADSDAALAELERKYASTMANGIAAAHAYRGERDVAFEWLQKAYQTKDPDLGADFYYPMFDNLHDDPRWLPFLRRSGMAPEQLARIRFEVRV